MRTIRVEDAAKAERRHQRDLNKAAKLAEKERKQQEKAAREAELTIAERNRKENPFIPSRKALGLDETDPIARAKAEGLALMQQARAEEAAEAAKNKPVKKTSKKKSKVKKKTKARKAA